MVHTNQIAVIILNWNGRDMMRLFLPSVVKYSRPEASVFVADNGSTDDSLRMLNHEFPEVVSIPLGKNYGFAEGYNKAISLIDAPYYVLLNSDVEVTRDWLKPLLQYMEEHPDAAACQPKLLSERAKDTFEYAGGAGGFIDHYGYPFCRGRIFDNVEKDHGQYDKIRPLLWATGAALFVRREDWRKSGGLDGRFFAHMEEIDLCWRLRARGRNIVCIPQSTVYHVGGATLNAGNPRKTYLNFRNNLLMLFKNLPESELKSVMRIRTLLDWVAALKFFLTGDIDNYRAVMKARKDYKQMRPDFEADRKRNMELAVNGGKDIDGRIKGSILLKYYLKGVKYFSQLHLD